MADSSQSDPLETVRRECPEKGLTGFRSLSQLFAALDRDTSGHLSVHEFVLGLQRRGFSLKKTALYDVFSRHDADGSRDLDWEEFLLALRPPLPESRREVVRECFASLDIVKDGKLNVEDMRVLRIEQAKRHPEYLSGERTLKQVLQGYLDACAFAESTDGEEVTYKEFVEYYTCLSATVEGDGSFQDMMYHSFGLHDSE